MRRALLVLLFGFLPVWAVLLLLALGTYTTFVPHIYLASAPWLVVAAILCSIVTLTLSLLALRQPPPTDSSSQFPRDR